jgi:hypothetical protein
MTDTNYLYEYFLKNSTGCEDNETGEKNEDDEEA